MLKARQIWPHFIAIIMMTATANPIQAQYFGKNKMRYEDFDFKVLESPHFELYHYLQNDSVAHSFIQLSERWYNVHQHLLRDTIDYNNPFILYTNHADFQQTTAIRGQIGVSTGGVTEALKNRVIMPLMESRAQTDHVLGHELVHAFQYNIMKSRDSLSLNNIRNLPLWMVEGLAEYMSIGPNDAHTAMWMRDAVINNDIPTLKDLSKNPRYFPYRYGQAFWSFVGGIWGDGVIPALFIGTAQMGLENAIDSIFNMDTERFSKMWANSLKKEYGKYLKDSTENTPGARIASKQNAGEINVSPSISPDGKYLVYLSEKDIFTLDLFLANAETGEIIRKISSKQRNQHIDDISFIESSGTWAPDNRRFAYVVFSEGQTKLLIVDAFNGRILRSLTIPGVSSFSNPTWSPDGEEIVINGLVQGQSDLYLYNLESDKVIKLTDDYYSDIQPNWSPDGDKIVFATDRVSLQNNVKGKLHFNLSVFDLSTGQTNNIDVFPGADNLNPHFSADGKSLIFVSNRDGFKNIYEYELNTGKTYQLTDLYTGVSGITAYSPAISVDKQNGKMIYTHFFDHDYHLYSTSIDAFDKKEVDREAVDFTASTLPPVNRHPVGIVDQQLNSINRFTPVPDDSIDDEPYKPKFKLDYIGNTGVGVSTSRYGTGLRGGVSMLFSDILGTNTLFAGVSLNGQIYDFGGQVSYINEENNFSWGASISHIPYRSGNIGIKRDSLNIQDTTLVVDNYYQDLVRIFEDRASVFGHYPFSQNRRIEGGVSFSRYSFRIDRYNNYYYQGLLVDREQNKRPSPDGFNLFSSNLAYVGDNSHFGIASPLKGHRYRIGAEKYWGEFQYHTFLADYRRYIFLNPVTVAFRGYHMSRYGQDAHNSVINPLYLGYPYLIRGYDNLNVRNQQQVTTRDFSVNDLLGNKLLVANAELRVPFSGPERLSLIKSRLFLTELTLFFDGGIAWDNESTQTAGDVQQGLTVNNDRKPVFSTGISMRVNLFGQLIVEPYYAIPFQREDVSFGTFGLNFLPGW